MAEDKRVAEQERVLARRGYPETMNAKQVTRALGVSRRTLHDLVTDGDIEAFRIRQQLRFQRNDVATYIRVNRVYDEKPARRPRPPARKQKS